MNPGDLAGVIDVADLYAPTIALAGVLLRLPGRPRISDLSQLPDEYVSHEAGYRYDSYVGLDKKHHGIAAVLFSGDRDIERMSIVYTGNRP